MLDTFEALNLEDADKLYNKKDYKGAFAAYRAYSFEFPQSRAMSYVLLRMGRCLQQLEKRNAAIKAYQDVVNYFPGDVRYAAAALFYIGQCHGQNGDEDKQTAVWARMVKDKDYVSQPNSGTALNHLGKAMEALGKYEEAAEYQWRTAVNFLKSNPEAAGNARDAVRFHYVVRTPNHEKLSQFYQEASGFDGRGRDLENIGIDPRYWSTVLSTVIKEAKGHYESEDVILRHIQRMKNPLAATKARFDYYQSRSHRNPPFMEKALAEIPELKKSPKYAGQQLSWDEARLLQGLGRYDEAIKAYRSSNREPDATWAIAECLQRMENYPEAIKTLREIESVGGNVASRASLEIAKVYRAAGDKAREVDQLRIVLRRYPQSGESSEAHRTLEDYGVALIGGQSEARD